MWWGFFLSVTQLARWGKCSLQYAVVPRSVVVACKGSYDETDLVFREFGYVSALFWVWAWGEDGRLSRVFAVTLSAVPLLGGVFCYKVVQL